MPFGHDWQCNHCGNQIRTGGLFEFYRDELGLRHRYGHRGSLEESVKFGVKGYFGEWYCPNCREVRNIVAIEFDVSQDGSIKANLARLEGIDQKEYFLVCDKCGTALKGYLDDADVCPKCNKGHFEQTSRFIS